ncbi:hypothetical protein [Heyndrickxia sporothermodurans]|uniref:Phage protein n=1 Tax=Heyndrickxia sporothermodurans TaxID=46224 RepID=A0AB37HBG6_9BACI|nr:hypothetical protein [Heyndrickxia sporothermodurans]MBL5768398.1 hypothetical protein [Heyndrickxia sporothermodurans]MBL5771037.1 hypothetical protein [Heyndrickxia sporothermodurans]MBL5774667.1 hypothetical protein [Heyndrickxia sporothermodurans]MBL5778139.1 hypothetical protein [Heyndrickxia sporothermodurans]MBL5785412.1 hypothetical protein [Heyndrickxia sporothermodurans]
MNPTLRDQLKQWENRHKKLIKDNRQQTIRRKSERLSEDDIKDLMGMNKPTYRRGKGGAWRNWR